MPSKHLGVSFCYYFSESLQNPYSVAFLLSPATRPPATPKEETEALHKVTQQAGNELIEIQIFLIWPQALARIPCCVIFFKAIMLNVLSNLEWGQPDTGEDHHDVPRSTSLLEDRNRWQRFRRLLSDLSGDYLFKAMLVTVNNKILPFRTLPSPVLRRFQLQGIHCITGFQILFF